MGRNHMTGCRSEIDLFLSCLDPAHGARVELRELRDKVKRYEAALETIRQMDVTPLFLPENNQRGGNFEPRYPGKVLTGFKSGPFSRVAAEALEVE